MTATWKIWNTFSPCNFQNWNDFPSLSTTMIAQLKWKIISFMWIFPEQFITRTVIILKNRSTKSPLPCLVSSMIEIVATSIEAFSANCSKLFHSGNLVLELILENDMQDWFGFQVGCQPFSSYNFVSRGSSDNGKSIDPALPQRLFKKHRQPHQCLIWAVGQKIALRFSSVRSRGTAIFNSNLTAWGKYFGVSSPFATRLFAQASTILWKIPNVFALLNMIFKRSSTRLSSNGKQFITIEPTRIHTRDGRTYNGNLRYTIRPIEDAINYFHKRQGLRH